jgi:hypothetical protein
MRPGHLIPINNDHHRQEYKSGRENAEGTPEIKSRRLIVNLRSYSRSKRSVIRYPESTKNIKDAERTIGLEQFDRDVFPLHQVTENHEGDGNGAKAGMEFDVRSLRMYSL